MLVYTNEAGKWLLPVEKTLSLCIIVILSCGQLQAFGLIRAEHVPGESKRFLFYVTNKTAILSVVINPVITEFDFLFEYRSIDRNGVIFTLLTADIDTAFFK